MSDILKHCNKHGDLTREQIIIQKPQKESYNPSLKCKTCYLDHKKKYYKTIKEKQSLYMKDWNKNNPEKAHASKIKRKYGITLDQYNKLVLLQYNKCAICKNETNKKLSVDHCHKTLKIRGLLCVKCNRGIGFFDDSITLLQSAINYLIQK